ncbi:MAG: PAS domain S-box protein [Planctomycetaceae bacterium]|nr:PAS domain S-box protein [Planctomycetaceae bacterium]
MTDEHLQTIETGNSDECREFHVVGIGASAGGLEALEVLFDEIPDDTGMAFVVVQHLSPDFKSHMEELLSRKTGMSIHRVENGMTVQPDNVYLIPPRMEMIIKEGQLLLTEKGPERALSHPIDQFFRSLAHEAGRYSVAVVLSGTGSDGSRGIRDVHEAGGLVISQDGHTAKFDGMPLNAQATGVVDLTLPPKAIAEALVRYVNEGLDPTAIAQQELVATMEEGVDRVFQLLHQLHGIDFSHYKANTVGRRIQRRIDLLGLDGLDQYVQQLNDDPSELNDLYKDLLIGVTRFFRDPAAFEVLEREVIPRLFASKDRDQPIRVWVAGCASGEEAYSIAMLLDEESRRRGVVRETKIFATDAHHVSLNAAARGVFPEESLSELSNARRSQYFQRQRDGFHVVPELRKQIVFAPHNLISDAPFTQMDLVTCRNLLIYLQPNAQKKALSMFHFSLKSGGTLFLGPSESPGEIADEFQIIDKKWRVYRKRRDVRLPLDTRLPFATGGDSLISRRASSTTQKTPRIDESMVATYDRLLDRRMPPSILVDEDYEILHIFGGAERYLQPRGGRPSNNLASTVIESLRSALTGALQHAARKQDIVRYTGIQVNRNGEEENLQILVEPIVDHTHGIQNLLVEFQSVTDASATQIPEGEKVDLSRMDRERMAALESELRFAQENLQATIEEMETSNEELQATNEELIASNEELQSTNEELHSVNEELYTVNAEYQRRVDELAQANDDMDNLLASTRVGVIFLDTDLCIRRFTPEISRLFHLMSHDIGRSIEGFTHHLLSSELLPELRLSLENEQEREVFATDRNDTPYLVRMLPYRSGDQVAGVVMTLVDITTLRQAEAETVKFRTMAESSTDPMMLINSRGELEYANTAAAQTLQFTTDELESMTVFDIDTQFDLPRYQQAFEAAGEDVLPPFESEWRRKDGHTLPVEISVSRVDLGGRRWLYANIRDITERQQTEEDMRLRTVAMGAASSAIIICDATADDLPIVYANSAFHRLTGYPEAETLGRNCRFLQGDDTDQKTVRSLREAIQNQKPKRVTMRNYRRDGSLFWNDLQISPVFDEGGRLKNYVGILHDVTRQMRLRDSSRRETKRVAAIINSTAEGMYGVDDAGYCTFANAACLQMLGYSKEDELIGQHAHSLISGKSADGSELPEESSPIFQTMQTGEGAHVDGAVFCTKDGSLIPVEYRSELLFHDGEPNGCVVSFQDITDRLAVASQLEQMGAMIDASNDAIIIWEFDGGIIRWNSGATSLYGYEAEEVLGRVTHTVFQTHHPEGWEEVRQTLLDSREWVGTLEQKTADGSPLIVFSRHQLVTLSDGRRYVLEINRDFSEQARAQEALENANRAFQQASEAKTQFLANISHELRTPMTAVLGFAEMLKSHSSDAGYLEKVETITRNGNYLLALLNDILDLSKIEAGKMLIKMESVSVPRLMEDIRALMGIRSRKEGVPLTYEFPTDVPSFITGDRIRIRQVLVNLIGNALKFTDSGEVRVITDLQDNQGQPQLRIQVKDTGIGMTPAQTAVLFEPFTQATAETSREFGGTGLGLSISKRLAESMNGRITVESEYRQGSTFTLWLPVEAAQMQSMGRPQLGDEAKDTSDGPSLPAIQGKILLADDRRDVWRVARYFLEKCGAQVEVAEDGRQAVDAVNRAEATQAPFDLILMDM